MNADLANKISSYLASQPIDKAWLFGSYARGEETKQSDIDLLVEFSKNSQITLLQYAHIINELEKITGKSVDLVESGYLKPFAKQSAEHDKILIYERRN